MSSGEIRSTPIFMTKKVTLHNILKHNNDNSSPRMLNQKDMHNGRNAAE